MREEIEVILRKNIHALLWAYRLRTGKLDVPEIEDISKYLKKDSICFDVGANAGSWSCGLAKWIPDGHIYAFEALPYHAEVLSKTLKILGQKKITIINKAVAAEKNHSVQIIRQDSEGTVLKGKNHIAVSGEGAQEMFSIETITLDSFWQEIGEKQIDFIKCDVEGFELFVLRGATELIKRCRPVFFNELNAEWCERYDYTTDDIFCFFQERNYTPFYLDAQLGMIAVDVEKHINRDILFVPEEKIIC